MHHASCSLFVRSKKTGTMVGWQLQIQVLLSVSKSGSAMVIGLRRNNAQNDDRMSG
jgi:hypothetical protein